MHPLFQKLQFFQTLLILIIGIAEIKLVATQVSKTEPLEKLCSQKGGTPAKENSSPRYCIMDINCKQPGSPRSVCLIGNNETLGVCCNFGSCGGKKLKYCDRDNYILCPEGLTCIGKKQHICCYDDAPKKIRRNFTNLWSTDTRVPLKMHESDIDCDVRKPIPIFYYWSYCDPDKSKVFKLGQKNSHGEKLAPYHGATCETNSDCSSDNSGVCVVFYETRRCFANPTFSQPEISWFWSAVKETILTWPVVILYYYTIILSIEILVT